MVVGSAMANCPILISLNLTARILSFGKPDVKIISISMMLNQQCGLRSPPCILRGGPLAGCSRLSDGFVNFRGQISVPDPCPFWSGPTRVLDS